MQHECIPQAILGMDVICQAKSGMGKTAVFVLSSLHQLEAKEGQVGAIVLCHTRELAFQINNEFERFSRYLPDVKVTLTLARTLILALTLALALTLTLTLTLTPALTLTLNQAPTRRGRTRACSASARATACRRHCSRVRRRGRACRPECGGS